jgi:hypothetical protein
VASTTTSSADDEEEAAGADADEAVGAEAAGSAELAGVDDADATGADGSDAAGGADEDAAATTVGAAGPAARVIKKIPTITTAAAARTLQPMSLVRVFVLRVTARSQPAWCNGPRCHGALLEEHWVFVETRVWIAG